MGHFSNVTRLWSDYIAFWRRAGTDDNNTWQIEAGPRVGPRWSVGGIRLRDPSAQSMQDYPSSPGPLVQEQDACSVLFLDIYGLDCVVKGVGFLLDRLSIHQSGARSQLLFDMRRGAPSPAIRSGRMNQFIHYFLAARYTL